MAQWRNRHHKSLLVITIFTSVIVQYSSPCIRRFNITRAESCSSASLTSGDAINISCHIYTCQTSCQHAFFMIDTNLPMGMYAIPSGLFGNRVSLIPLDQSGNLTLLIRDYCENNNARVSCMCASSSCTCASMEECRSDFMEPLHIADDCKSNSTGSLPVSLPTSAETELSSMSVPTSEPNSTTPTTPSKSKTGLIAGVMAGGVVSTIIGIIIVLVLAYWIYRLCKASGCRISGVVQLCGRCTTSLRMRGTAVK